MGGSFKKKHTMQEIILLSRKAEQLLDECGYIIFSRKTVPFFNDFMLDLGQLASLRRGVDYQVIKHSGHKT